MESSGLEGDKNIEENIIKDIRNIFGLKKPRNQTSDTTTKYIRNLFR